MKAFGTYISKYLFSFFVFALFLLVVNILVFIVIFGDIVAKEYGTASPSRMLENVAADLSGAGLSNQTRQTLNQHHIWAMFLDPDGRCIWETNLPKDIPSQYTMLDVAVFSKGYLKDYPVFIRNVENGLLVLGYPKDSFMKLPGNYLPLRAVNLFPVFVTGLLFGDGLLLFGIYSISKWKISKNTEPILTSIEMLTTGKPVDLNIPGELSEIAECVNRASRVLSRQNQARVNWISGVSHDIRTPLSMIMGYSDRILETPGLDRKVCQEAGIIRSQSAKIKDLVQDLNLVSQLEYDMQPLHKRSIRLSKLLRSFAADLLNQGIDENYSIEIEIDSKAELVEIEGDSRLILRAVGNLVNNSIHHNPQGCRIVLALHASKEAVCIVVADNGTGLSPQKQKDLEKPHYMESTDERLDLRHGLGLLLVKQIVAVHEATMKIESEPEKGCKTTLSFKRK